MPAKAMSLPLGDHDGRILARPTTLSETKSDGRRRVAKEYVRPPRRRWPLAEKSSKPDCESQKAVRLPSGDQPIGFTTLSAISLGSPPPRNGTRHSDRSY